MARHWIHMGDVRKPDSRRKVATSASRNSDLGTRNVELRRTGTLSDMKADLLNAEQVISRC